MICHNPERAERDRTVREQILERLQQEIHHADGLPPSKRSELYGALGTKPAYKRFLRKTKTGKLRIDRAAVNRETKLDGKFLLRTSDESLTAADLAEGYKALYEAERAGAISSTRSTCAPPTTAARTASKPTSSSAGWRCC